MEELKAQSPFDLATAFQGLSKKTPEERQLRLVIVLMQPLADPAMLRTCRARTSRYVPNPYNPQADPGENEVYLDLDPLGEAWRKEWKQLPQMAALHVEFDISLPRGEDGNIVEDMRWQAGGQSDTYVFWIEYQSLAMQMATYARMKVGGNVSFTVLQKNEGLYSKCPEELGQQLERLAKYSKGSNQ